MGETKGNRGVKANGRSIDTKKTIGTDTGLKDSERYIDKSKRVNNLEGVFVTAKAMGSILGVTDRQIRNLANDGMIPKMANGSYDLVFALNSYINNLKVNQREEKAEIRDEEAYQKERTLHERAKRQKAELQLGQMRGDLHTSQVVEMVMTDMLSRLRSKLLALPTKIAPIIIARNDIATVEGILQNEIYEALSELKDYEPEDFKDDKFIDLEEFEDVINREEN